MAWRAAGDSQKSAHGTSQQRSASQQSRAKCTLLVQAQPGTCVQAAHLPHASLPAPAHPPDWCAVQGQPLWPRLWVKPRPRLEADT
jgi:hypothetical protein